MFKEGQQFTHNGITFKYMYESRKNGGGTHFFAFSMDTLKPTHIAYADLIAEKAKAESMNPRFLAFLAYTKCTKTGTSRNAAFMEFISDNKAAFMEQLGLKNSDPISDQGAFTRFILNRGTSHPERRTA